MRLKKIISILVCLALCVASRAQETLPNMSIKSSGGKVLLTWNCTYDGVKSIAVQRSSDSIKNYSTVGYLSNPKKGVQSFQDELPNAGRNYYRLYILFPYDLEWYSNTFSGYVDSTLLSKKNTTVTNNTTKNSTTESTDFYYTPSSTVFTNPYTGHININIADAGTKRYSLKFFDPNRNEVLKVSRIQKPKLVLEKRNFNARGTYSFQLFEGSSLIETGYITLY